MIIGKEWSLALTNGTIYASLHLIWILVLLALFCKAVDILEQLNVQCTKIASGEIDNTPMLARIKETKKPVILSTGLSDFDDVDRWLTITEITRFVFYIA